MLATVIETKELLQTIAASAIAGVGVTIAFSMAIYGATRFADLSRDERTVGAYAAAMLAVLGLAASIAAVVFGIIVMTQK